MRSFFICFLWCLLVSLPLNAGWIVFKAFSTFRNLDASGVTALAFSFWSFIAYTVLGAVILASFAVLVRRLFV
jgi:hypothetical protein